MGSTLAELGEDEDCQRLSVTLPGDLAPGESLPVMVWIHGGSYAVGAGDAPIMDPKALVVEQRVVAVTVTYRLGILGFLGGGPGRPANLGLLDQREAFRWVRRNIAAFGGDPDRVTAYGQSAGGDAVARLMATPDAPSLFSRAIIQSAPLGISRGREAMNAAMLRAADDLGPETPVAEVVERQPAVVEAGASYGLRSAMPFGPQYGQVPLPVEDRVEEVWGEVAPRIDVLIGHTAEEARLFVVDLPALQRVFAIPLLGAAVRRVLVAFLTWAVYGRDTRRFARRHARAGGRADSYRITWSAPGNRYGSAHIVDLPLLFGDEETWRDAALVAGADWADVDAHARQVRRLWADFARGTTLPARGRIPGVLRHRRA